MNNLLILATNVFASERKWQIVI